MTLLFLLSAIIIIECRKPEPPPASIRQFLAKAGCQADNVYFEKIGSRTGGAEIYHSSRPVYYKGLMTELWEVRRVAKLTKVYYIITPYYQIDEWLNQLNA